MLLRITLTDRKRFVESFENCLKFQAAFFSERIIFLPLLSLPIAIPFMIIIDKPTISVIFLSPLMQQCQQLKLKM